jgi:hypothetical protein
VDAEARRHARESGERQQPREAAEERRQREPDCDGGDEAADELGDVRLRRNRCAEDARPERGEGECGEPLAACLRDEQERQREARDRAAEVGEADQRTITAARSRWPCSSTTSV